MFILLLPSDRCNTTMKSDDKRDKKLVQRNINCAGRGK